MQQIGFPLAALVLGSLTQACSPSASSADADSAVRDGSPFADMITVDARLPGDDIESIDGATGDIGAMIDVGGGEASVPTDSAPAVDVRDVVAAPDSGITAPHLIPPVGTATAPTVDGTIPTPVPVCTVTVGTGSGNLVITQGTLHDGDVVCIRAGSYSGGSFHDISAARSITIQNIGVVNFTGGLSFSNLHNVVFSGAGVAGSSNGILLHDIVAAAVTVSGHVDGFTFQYIDLRHIGDRGIFIQENSLHYDGTDATLMHDLRVLHCNFDTIGWHSITVNPYAPGGTQSLVRRFEIAFSTFGNTDPGYLMYLGNVFEADVHHNVIQHINPTNTRHNGMMFLQGDGAFHHNYLYDYQGEGVRAWPYSLNSRGRLDIYDNAFFNSRKYSAVEVQPDPAVLGSSTYAHPTDVRVVNNTAGNLNLINDWYSAMVDVYNANGVTLDASNNLLFALTNPRPTGYAGGMVVVVPLDYVRNAQGNLADTMTASANLYFPTWTSAGLAEELTGRLAAISPAIDHAVVSPLVTDDIFGRPRGPRPDVGAYEF